MKDKAKYIKQLIFVYLFEIAFYVLHIEMNWLKDYKRSDCIRP